MQTLISADELAVALDDQDLFIFDCRGSLSDTSEGRQLFDASHIPGAQYADLNEDLSGPVIPGKTGRHPLPERDDFVATVSRWGVTQNGRVVAYDDAGGAFASRLWWMFRWLGHRDVAVLDGGFSTWQTRGNPVTDAVIHRPASNFNAKDPLTRMVTADDVANTRLTIIDARGEERYRGEVEPIDPVAGHIPGAICVPFANNLDTFGQFKDTASLAARFEEAGVPRDQESICYCGSGVSAAHNILAMVHSGYPEPALYPGSWSEWITDPNRPVS